MIIDTNALSAFFDAHAAVVRCFEHADDIAIPVIVLGEYRFGLLGSRKRRAREDILEELVRATRDSLRRRFLQAASRISIAPVFFWQMTAAVAVPWAIISPTATSSHCFTIVLLVL